MRALAFLLAIASLAGAAETPIAKRSTGELIDELDSRTPPTRLRAVNELGRRGEEAAFLPLLERLFDEQPTIRAHAAEALRGVGDERAVPVLYLLLSDPDETVRCRAVLAMAHLGGRYLVPTMRRGVSDPACVVRAASVRALGELGDPLSLGTVLRAQREEPVDVDGAVTASALVAAAKLGGSKGLEASLAIAGTRLDEFWLLRSAAVHAMGLTGDARWAPSLAKSLAGDPDLRVCGTAATALGRLGARVELEAALDDPDPLRRRAAVAGIGEIEGAAAVALLIRAAGDEDPGVALEAGAALIARGERQAIPLLVNLLDVDAPIWLGAMQVLERYTGQRLGRNPPAWRAWFERRVDGLVWDPEAAVFREGG